MRLIALVLLAAGWLLQDAYDLAALRHLLDDGMLLRNDAPAFEKLKAAATPFKADLAKDKDPVAKILRVALDEDLKAWTPEDARQRAELAWVAGHAKKKWTPEYRKWMADADVRLAFSAARAYRRTTTDEEQAEFAAATVGKPADIARAGYADRMLPAMLASGPTRSGMWVLIPMASPDRIIAFLHLATDDDFSALMSTAMSMLKQMLEPKLKPVLEAPEKLVEPVRPLLVPVLVRLGGFAALFDVVGSGDKAVRDEAKRQLETQAAADGFWISPWIEFLERKSTTVELGKWAHGVIERLTGDTAAFTTRADAAKHWRTWLRTNAGSVVKKYVNKAIDRGVAYLQKMQDPAAGWMPVGQGGTGMTALALFTLLHGGVKLDHDSVRRGFDALCKTPPGNNTYQEGAIAMACGQYCIQADAATPAPIRKRLTDAVRQLGACQLATGAWAYERGGGDWDHSNIQLAMLGLAQAMAAGEKTAAVAWDKARRFLTNSQNADGGWGYHRGEVPQSYGSMTAAGACGVLLALKATRPKEFEAGFAEKNWEGPFRKAVTWLSKNLSIEKGHFPHEKDGGTTDKVQIPDWKRGSPYYWLYSLARLCLLADVPKLSDRDWYAEGALFILSHQAPDGAWTDGSFSLADTCFAILFLRRVKIDVETESGSGRKRGPVEKSDD